jgi:hypothetical protein
MKKLGISLFTGLKRRHSGLAGKLAYILGRVSEG